MINHIKNLKNLTETPFSFESKWFSSRLVSWYQKNKQDYPWRVLWQKQQNPYHIWLSEIMLQQTTLKVVIPAYQNFLQRFPTVGDLAKATEEEVRQTVKGLGYYRRFGFLHQAAKMLIERKAKDRWPKSYIEWKKLPGVGDYTAAAVASIAFGEKVSVVDGNVERVFCRYFDVRLPTDAKGLKAAFQSVGMELISSRFPGDFNQGLMELGQKVCHVSTPDCGSCPVKKHCLAKKNESVTKAPAPKEKRQYKEVFLRLVIFHYKQFVFLQKRPSSDKFLKGITGFKTEVKKSHASAFKVKDLTLEKPYVLGSFKHSITQYKIKTDVVICSLKSKKKPFVEGTWVKESLITEKLTASLDLKAWKIYQKSLHESSGQ